VGSTSRGDEITRSGRLSPVVSAHGENPSLSRASSPPPIPCPASSHSPPIRRLLLFPLPRSEATHRRSTGGPRAGAEDVRAEATRRRRLAERIDLVQRWLKAPTERRRGLAVRTLEVIPLLFSQSWRSARGGRIGGRGGGGERRRGNR
jgi:hypothetical protein